MCDDDPLSCPQLGQFRALHRLCGFAWLRATILRMAVPARLDDDQIDLTFRGPRGLRAVRFRSDLVKRGDPPEFHRRGRSLTWDLCLPRPVGVDRVEYQLELAHADGTTELVTDPANPLVAPGPFGDKSVLELPGYERPVWLDEEAEPGTLEPLAVKSRLLRAEVPGLLWTSAGADPGAPLPLLVVHDGPEYAEFSALTHMLDSAVAQLELPPMRAALLQPVHRNETYSAAKRYADALAVEIVPSLPGTESRVGMGASLGALAMLHAHRIHPNLLDGLFLQSGSFFRRELDGYERGFARFERIARFVGRVRRARDSERPIPVTMTCGLGEENLGNNRAMRDALAKQGYDVELVEHRDAHNWVSWRDVLEPHLTLLLERLWV
jgi:enterochelin esterase-like enzyme